MSNAGDEDSLVIEPQPRQKLFLRHTADVVVFGGASGGGKMLSLETWMPTPNGWVQLKDIHAGQVLFGMDGQPTMVLSESQTKRTQGWRLSFDDGAVIDCCEDHLWLTFTAAELNQMSRRTDEFRERRKAGRKSRSNIGQGKKWRHTEEHRKVLSSRITQWNIEHPPERLPQPSGSVKTTKAIVETLSVGKRGRANHAIPVCGPITCPRRPLPLDPYLLGVWLGDGTTTVGGITTGDPEILEAFERDGWACGIPQIKPGAKCVTVTILGLTSHLRLIELLNDKHVPWMYLFAAKEQRLALLQGLMDTDGSADLRGRVEFTSTNNRLAQGVADLVRSLGMKASVIEGRATLNGRDCGPKYRVNFSPNIDVFRLDRKLKRMRFATRRTTRFRYIVKAEPIEAVEMKCLTVDAADGLFLASEHFIPTHNTFSLLMEPLRHKDNPDFKAIILRRSYPLILKPGGIWDDSKKIYSHIPGAEPLLNPPRWRFPSGATVTFQHLENDQTVYEYKSAQIPLIMWDQLEEFSASQFWYLFSRNRSTCGVHPYVRATCNPDAESWLASFLAWWIDQDTGYPIPERAGKTRWMARDGEQIIWGNTAEDVQATVGPDALPKSVSFVPAFLDDNPALTKKDPGYRANLQMLTTVERERLLRGNWKIRPAAGVLFPRTKWKYCQEVPAEARLCRYVDKAAHEGTAGARTAMVLVGESKGRWYIVHARAGRWSEFEVEDQIKTIAYEDRAHYGWRVRTCVEREPGSGGKFSARSTIKNLAGFDVGEKPARTAKHIAWKPLASQVQAENVWIVTGDPNAPAAWDWGEFINELDVLAGDPKQDAKRLRDLADAASGGANELMGAGDVYLNRPLLCSGDDYEGGGDVNQPLTDDELTGLPDILADIMRGARRDTGGGYGRD